MVHQTVLYGTPYLSAAPRHELAAQILLLAVKQARSSPYFSALNRTSQNEILGHMWGPLFILKASQWYPEAACMLTGVQGTFGCLRRLHLNTFELEMLENILLCRPDFLTDTSQAALAHLILERAMDTFLVIYII